MIDDRAPDTYKYTWNFGQKVIPNPHLTPIPLWDWRSTESAEIGQEHLYPWWASFPYFSVHHPLLFTLAFYCPPFIWCFSLILNYVVDPLSIYISWQLLWRSDHCSNHPWSFCLLPLPFCCSPLFLSCFLSLSLSLSFSLSLSQFPLYGLSL